MCAINRGSLDADAVESCLDNRILFGMNCTADFDPLARGYAQLIAQATQFETVLLPCRGAIVACAQDLFIPHREGAHVVAAAGGTLGDD